MSFNPHSPSALGLEWQPIHESCPIMSSVLEPLGMKMTSTANETVDTVWMYSPWESGSKPESIQVDVYQHGTFPDATVTSVTAYPSADHHISTTCATWNGTGGSTNYYTFINDVTQVPVTSPFAGNVDDDFIYSATGEQWYADFAFDGLAAALAGKHVVSVRLEAHVNAYSLVGYAGMTITPYLKINDVVYFGSTRAMPSRAPGGHLVTEDWYVNPALLRSWLPADLAAFDSGTATAAAGWWVQATGSANVIATVLQGNMQVRYAGTDYREAVGWVTVAQQSAGELDGTPRWFPMTMQRPDGTAGWAKTSATDYRLTLRRQTVVPGGKNLGVMTLYGYDGIAPNGWSKLDVRMRSDTQLPYTADVPGDGKSWAPAIALEVGANPSVDSQPYIDVDEHSEVYSGVDFRQYFTTPNALPDPDFVLVRVMCGRNTWENKTIDSALSGDLTLGVYRASDDQLMGGTVTITADEFENDEPAGVQTAYAYYKSVIRKLSAKATLAINTQYYVKITSDAAAPETGWRVETCRSIALPDTYPSNIKAATFGGTTDYLRIDGVTYDDSDACVTVFTLPDQVTGLTATATAHDGCVDYVALAWNESALGADFAEYQVQRADSVTGTWCEIASVVDESVNSFNDWESKRGSTAYYRVRVVRTDGAVSDWSSTATATATAPCCGYTLTSNVAPELTVWFDDVQGTERETEFTQNVTIKQFYGRNYSVGFHELEDRGVTFTRTLLVAADNASDGTPESSTPGLSTFSGLLAIARPAHGGSIPYVCVHEETGDRWFCTLRTPTGTRNGIADVYTAEVEFTEVTDVPSSVTATTAPGGGS